jgi:hypothetical protein
VTVTSQSKRQTSLGLRRKSRCVRELYHIIALQKSHSSQHFVALSRDGLRHDATRASSCDVQRTLTPRDGVPATAPPPFQ